MAAEIVHHPSPGKTEECQSEDTCGMKKKMKLRFSLTMLSEEDVEMGGHQEGEWKDEDIEDDCFDDDDDDDDDLLVSLANMSFNLIDQDPDTDKPLCGCDNQFNEIVIMPEQADLAIFSGKIGKLIKEQNNLFMKSKCKYIAAEHNRIQMTDTMSVKITIFQCMATTDHKSGVPVVLNFTGTDNFFSCTNEGEEKILKLTTYDKKKLLIPGDDPEKLALVFYMSQEPDSVRRFESALHRGWFIHTADGDLCKLQEGKDASNGFVLIETDSTKTIKYY